MNDDLQVKIGGDPSGAVGAMDAVNARARAFSQDLIGEVGKITAAYLGFEAALKGISDGIGKADVLRDLSLSIDSFTGKVGAGTEALRFFEEQAKRTRFTADELAKVFRDLLPLAGARGFSATSTQDISVLLSQFATVSGKSLDELESGLQRMLAGRMTAGRNPLLMALGFTKENVDVTWEQFFGRLMEKTKDFDKFGQSFESAGHKIKDAWEVAFGTGFNDAMGGSRRVLDELLVTFNDPHIVAAIDAIGASFGRLALQIGNAAKLLSGGGYGSGAGVAPWMQWLTDFVASNGVPSDIDVSGAHFGPKPKPGQFTGTSGGWDLTPEQEWKQHMDELQENLKKLGKVGIDASLSLDKLSKKALESANAIHKGDEQWHRMVTNEFDQLLADYGSVGRDTAVFGAQGRFDADGNLLNPFRSAIGGAFNGQGPWMTADTDGNLRTAKELGVAQAKAFHDAMINDNFVREFGYSFAGIIEGGGRHVLDILGQGLPSLVAQSTQDLMTRMFGKAGAGQTDANGNFLPGNDPSKFYDAQGNDITGRANASRIGFGALQVGAGGYAAGLSGQPGARTGAVVSGAMAGAEFGLPGIIIGGVIGAIGGFLGAKQAQSDYMYGVPTIDSSGVAHLGNTKNLVPSRVKEIEAQVQAEYDQIHDGLIGLITKFPNVAIPSFEQISGKFQDNPSAHWQEHLQQWITGTLPHQLMGAVEDELATGFSGLGMSKDAFSHIFDFMQGIDPSKAVQELVMLADSLKTINEATTGFHQGFGSVLNDVGMKATRTPGAVLGEMDDEIIRLAKSLGSLSPEGQISTLQQIAGLEKQRWDAEKAAATELLNLAQQAKEQFSDFFGQLDLQGMVKADGSPDFYSQSQFYKKRTDTDLSEIYGATTTAEAQKWLQKFFQDVMQAEQLGIQGDPSHRNDWIQWARTAGQTGQTTLDDTIKRLGGSIDGANSLFNSKVDPALDAFTGKVTTTSTAVDNLGGAIGRTIDPIDRFTDHMNSIVGTLAAADARIARMFSGSGGNDNGFATRTAAARVR